MISSGVNTDLLVFTKQFSAMVRSNLQLVHALDSLARETPRRKLRLALFDVLSKVKAGRDFDRALADHPKIFNSTYVGVVRAIEDLFPLPVDVSNLTAQKPHVRPSAQRDAVYAF